MFGVVDVMATLCANDIPVTGRRPQADARMQQTSTVDTALR